MVQEQGTAGDDHGQSWHLKRNLKRNSRRAATQSCPLAKEILPGPRSPLVWGRRTETSSVRERAAALSHVSRKLPASLRDPRGLEMKHWHLGNYLIRQPFPPWPAAALCSPRQKNVSPREHTGTTGKGTHRGEEPRSIPETQKVVALPSQAASCASGCHSTQQFSIQ